MFVSIFVSMLSKFCLHFVSILSPFGLHLVSILSPLKQILLSSSPAKKQKMETKPCVWRGPEKVKKHHAILAQTLFWSNTPSLWAMFFPRMHFCCPRPPALPSLVFSPPFCLHFVSIFASILSPFCLLFVPMLSPFCLHLVFLFISFNWFGATLHHFWPKSLFWSNTPSLFTQKLWSKSMFWSNAP